MPLQQRALRGWGTRGASQSSTFALSNSRLQDIEVEVVHVREKYSVSVTVPSTATIMQVKQILVSDMGEGEAEDVRLFLYSGTAAELMDSEKIGTRRKLHGDGFGRKESEEESLPDGQEKEEAMPKMPPLSNAKEEPDLETSSDPGLAVDQHEKEHMQVEQAIKLLDSMKLAETCPDFTRKIDALYQRNSITLKLGLAQLPAHLVEQASIHSGIKADLDKLKEVVKDNKDNALIVEKACEIESIFRLTPGSIFGVAPAKHDLISPIMKSPPMQNRSTLTDEVSANPANGAKDAIKEIPAMDVTKNDDDSGTPPDF